MIRKIVNIDQEKCDGCGLCVPSCAEGAISIVDGKAQIAADNLCDGLGACLGDCPKDAITIIEREADEFDEEAVEEHLHKKAASGEPKPAAAHAAPAAHHHHGGCPGSRVASFTAPPTQEAHSSGMQPSQLAQWPVQLHLVPVTAPYFQNADLLITADCVPFAYAGYHREFLAGKAVVIGCPKLDDNSAYLQKLTELFRVSSIKSITVLRMEVPCCGGIVMAARQALAASGKEIPFREVTISIRGEVVER
ncbi:ATP-binding protein [Geomonas sp.]|uniref:ATP-binding protein n=1 Tax=Geomonas sp. TaxID=2651584 RepID=UPI002B461868|nr:4Fe-4S binding protein [Geomonas sp.]HJV35673.1 4Fe-4S binding protein [Geomonas sp.]